MRTRCCTSAATGSAWSWSLSASRSRWRPPGDPRRSMSPTTIGYIWCALAALASALATLLIKFSGQQGPDWNLLRVAYLGGAGATYALGFVCYTVALQRLEISLAYPVMTGIAMAFVAAFGVLAL